MNGWPMVRLGHKGFGKLRRLAGAIDDGRIAAADI
jgi:hypothetical protein